jgi:hypothetical protein
MASLIKSPNYIPVKNKVDFDIDVITYYNQYYATEYETQQRRILRNYYSNLQVTNNWNKNPFIANPNIKYNFFYANNQSWLIATNLKQKTSTVYMKINNCWQFFRCFKNTPENCNIIKNLNSKSISN